MNIDKYMELFATQNEEQKEASLLQDRYAAIVGNPGSGKTRTLVTTVATRVAFGQDPTRILAMTFTKAAATEMNRRLGEMGIDPVVGTIHSICLKILREETNLIAGLELDTKNRIMKQGFKAVWYALLRKRTTSRLKTDRDAITSFIEACKARGTAHVHGDPFGLNMQLSYSFYKMAEVYMSEAGVLQENLIEIYTQLERFRADNMLFNFDDMLLWAWMALISNEYIRNNISAKYDMIVVDEVQDTNIIQWDIAMILAGMPTCIFKKRLEGQEVDAKAIRRLTHYIEVPENIYPEPLNNDTELYVFGDASQSIYGFRFAEPELFVQYATNENVVMKQLSTNYRSVRKICDIATQLVKNKRWHLGGDIVAVQANKHGDHIYTDIYDEFEEEAVAAIDFAMGIVAAGGLHQLNEYAILSRTSAALHLAEIKCIQARIPYRKLASGSFFDAKEVRDILAYLYVVCGMDYEGKYLNRIINTPFRFIGKQAIEAARTKAIETGNNLLNALEEYYKRAGAQASELKRFRTLLVSLNAKVKTALKFNEELLERKQDGTDYLKEGSIETSVSLREKKKTFGPAGLIEEVLDETRYVDYLRSEDGLGEEEERLLNIVELKRIASSFLSPVEFLEYVDICRNSVKQGRTSLQVAEESTHPAVTLSTIHRAKGLEWDHVRVIDVVDGRFPHSRVLDKDEELRLLYVAITRARNSCILTCSGGDGVSSYISSIEYLLHGSDPKENEK